MPHSCSLTACSDLENFWIGLEICVVLEWVEAEKEMSGQERNRDRLLLFQTSYLSSYLCHGIFTKAEWAIHYFVHLFIHSPDIYCVRQWS